MQRYKIILRLPNNKAGYLQKCDSYYRVWCDIHYRECDCDYRVV